MPVLLAQCALPPVLLAVISLVQRRFGPAVGGLLAGLPVTSVPITLFTALSHGSAYAARAATATLGGAGAVCLLCWTYARVARRLGQAGALACAGGAFAMGAVALDVWRPGITGAGAAGALALAAVTWGWPREAAGGDHGSGAGPGSGRGGLRTRMLVVTGWVVVVCAVSGPLGARGAGLLSPFPVLVVAQAVHTHRVAGAVAVRAFLRGVVRAEYAFLVCFGTLAVLLREVDAALAFAVAVTAAALTQAGTARVAVTRGAASSRHSVAERPQPRPTRIAAAVPAAQAKAPSAAQHTAVRPASPPSAACSADTAQ